MADAYGFSRTAAVTLLVAAAVLGGCGDGGDDASDESNPGSTSSAPDPTDDPERPDREQEEEEEADAGADPDAGSSTDGAESDAEQPIVIGRWLRETDTACAAGYPLVLDIQPSIYLVELDPAVAPVIDSGEWVLGEAETISLTAPNDAMVDFRLDLGADNLTITDADGCEVTFRRDQ